ncbi:MAG: glycosyltransferase [Rhizobiaceae bacterium]
MHLLFATSIVPDGALSSGYEIANAAIIDALRRIGARVTVLGYTWPGKPPSDPENTIVLGEIDVRTEGASHLRKVGWLMRAVSGGMTFASAKLTVVGQAAVRQIIDRAGPFDGYVLNGAQMAGAYQAIFADKPKLFVAHNVEHHSAEQNAQAATSTLQKFLFRREAKILRDLESRLCVDASFVYALAEEDRIALGVGSDDRSVALPLVTTEREPPPPRERKIECDAALIGTWSWQPNRIGLDWFLQQVTPHLPSAFTIRIAGHAPADLKADHPGVSFVGRVADAETFVCSAAVVPLVSRAGTGVQLKTIQTFELGLPSVATPLSLRGIDHRPSNCVEADDPAAFAQALMQAARQRAPDADGRAFYRRQRAELDLRVRHGLTKAGLLLPAPHRELIA